MNTSEILALLNTGAGATSILQGFKPDVTGTPVEYSILHGWDARLAKKCDEEWGAYNIEVLRHLRTVSTSEAELIAHVEKLHMEDAHWCWLGKAFFYTSSEYNWFFLVANGSVQGVCLIYHPKDSVIDGRGIFYIEYVAVAPWNRPNPLAVVQFKGVGSELIKTASHYAVDHLGLQAGFCLHSLPKAIGYYTKLGMVECPQHSKDGLMYFEMPVECAGEFLGAGYV
ncbi:GNAT family N-acetyltransferase [Pseudomonas segetis]